MAQPRTQDNQKVFQSATQNFKSFVGAVDNVSSSKNISEIYDNMTKLFDAFTQGALTGQGANSEILLRTVYRSLSDDFLKIIQDTDAVEKIVELIKSKQESIDPEQVDQAMVSETTKKVVTKTLDPYECDPMSVVLDFVDELQTAILQVKLNLSREYERKKLAYAKSYEGQQEDLDRLNQEYTEQDEAMVEVLEQMSEDEETWKEDSLEKLEKLLETFNEIGKGRDSNYELLQGVDKTLSTDRQIQQFLKEKPTKFSPKKTLDAIKGVGQLKSKPDVTTIESQTKNKTVVKSTQTEVQNTVVVKEKAKKDDKKPPQPKRAEKPKVLEKPVAKDDKKKEKQPTKEKTPETPAPVKKEDAKPVQPQVSEKTPEPMGKKGPPPVQQEPIKVAPPPPLPVVPPQIEKEEKPKEDEKAKKPIMEKPIMEKPIIQKPVMGKPIIEKAVDEKPKVEKPTLEKATKEKPTIEKPKVEPVQVQKPTLEKPTVEKPKVEKPVEQKPIVEKPVVEKPKEGKTIVEKPKVEKPKVEKPITEKPVVAKPIVEKPKVETPTFEKPRDEKPVIEKPVQEKPKVEKPLVAKPVEKKPLIGKPLVKKPILEKPTEGKPIVQKPILNKPKLAPKKVNKPIVHKPLVKKPLIQKPVLSKPVLAKPTTGKSIFQKPITQKPLLQKPIVEKPVNKKPLLEKPKVEKPKVVKPKIEKIKSKAVKKAPAKIIKKAANAVPKSPLGKKTPVPKLAQKNFAKELDKTLNAGKAQEQKYTKQLGAIEKFLTKDEKDEKQKHAEDAKQHKEDDSIFKKTQEREKKVKAAKDKTEKAKKDEEKKKQAAKKKEAPKPAKAQPKPDKTLGKKLAPEKPKDTKLKVKPNAGMCTCPICGSQHLPGMHSHGGKKKGAMPMPMPVPVPMGKGKQGKLAQPAIPLNPLGGDQSEGGIPQDKIVSTLGTIHDNLSKTMNNKKFKNSFMLNYKPIQKGVKKQLDKVGSDEKTISQDLQETEKGIKKLKDKKRGSFLSRLMNGGITGLIFKVIGGLILIALARIALKKWKEAYMPPTDGSTMTIFGFQIPGWDTIKAIGIGIYNFITVGLANHYDRLQLFFGELREKLFGKKGALRSMAQVRHILRRLVFAWIIGQTKKAVRGACDWLLDILAVPLNALAPGAGTISKFLIKLLPEIYSFITTQIMLMWSKNKRDAEEAESAAAEGMEMAVNTGTTTAMSMISSQLKGLSSGVKPYKGQMANIPGLETQRGPKGRGPRKLAIMRRVPIKYHKSFEKAKQMQNKRLESDMEENKKNDEKRINGGGDVLISQIIEDTSKMNQAVDEFTGSIGTWVHSWDDEKVAKIRKYAPKEYENADNWVLADKWRWDKEFKQKVIHNYTSSISQEIYKRTIVVELDKVSKYMDALGKSQRFKNVKGPLYDPVKGWNPGYRVYASDLKTAIPFNPLEKIHSKADIPIGEPAKPEGDSIGWMPFKWISNGVPVNVHPINWELARANAIWNLYNWLMKNRFQNNLNNWNTTNIEDFKKAILPDVFTDWRSWNYPVGDHRSEATWGKAYPPETYQYGDQFVRFINAFRAGKIDHGNNNLDTAMKLRDPTYLEKMFDKMHKKLGDYGTAAVAGAAIGGAVMGPVGAVAGAAIGAAAVGVYKGAKWVGQKMDDLQRALSYDQDPDGEEEEQTEEVEEEESSVPLIGWLINGVKKVVKVIKKIVKKVSRKVAALNRIKEWRGKTYFGVNYGDIRDFMIDTGVLQLFSQGQIINPIGKTIPLLDKLIDMKVIGKGSDVEEGNSMHSLMEAFFSYNRIDGYDWKKMSADKTAQAAFAQSLLEYLALKVIPQWNIVEKLLSNDVTKKTDETKKAMDEGVQVLANLLSFKSIMDHLSKYLRFPNMKVKVIDFSNARDDHDRELLEQFRKEQGIPNSSEKNQILSQWQGVWAKIPSMNDEELQGSIDNLKKLIGTAAFEAKYTGEFTYEKQLRKFYTAMIKEKDERLKAQAAGDKIVQKPGGIERVMEGPPPKTMLEMEEERKAKEAEEARKAAEEEEKRKTEEEKRLQEEAKRQEELKIAQAKIAAMEAIKKQEQNYENILEKMVQDPATVTDEELKSLGDDVKNLKQEAENKIAQLPREEREMKLALIRGDKVSEKTFAELKETAVGLSGSLQTYIQEVNKIPVGSIMAIQNTPGTPTESKIQLQDSDNVDMGDQ